MAKAVGYVKWTLEGFSEPMIGPAYLKLQEEVDRRDVEDHLHPYFRRRPAKVAAHSQRRKELIYFDSDFLNDIASF